MVTLLANDSSYSNVNTYGLVIILTLGVLIILINTWIVEIMTLARRLLNTDSWKNDIWYADGIFQIHRSNCDIGEAKWKGEKAVVPVTDESWAVERRDLNATFGYRQIQRVDLEDAKEPVVQTVRVETSSTVIDSPLGPDDQEKQK